MSEERWLTVPSMAHVEVSSLGRVRVKPYEATMPYGGLRTYGGYEGFGQWDGTRYIYMLKGKSHKVHRMVCEAFNGPPAKGQVCMHLDEDARNNKPWNLEWGTQKQNLNAPGFLKYCRTRTGPNNPRARGRRKKMIASVISYKSAEADHVFQSQ